VTGVRRLEAFFREAFGMAGKAPDFSERLSVPADQVYCCLEDLDDAAINRAYEYCRQTTRQGSRTFYLGARFLPFPKRRAMWAVYNFCRLTDDIVDRTGDLTSPEICARLQNWEAELLQAFEGHVQAGKLPLVAWLHTTQTFELELQPPLDLLKGVRMDLEKNRYANFEELRLYCYRVASTVGLMASQVMGYSDPCALEYAANLGIAMQLTNILRDVGEDAQAGRIYLPQDEMARFGYTEAELLRGEVNPRFIRLMQFQIERTRRYYRQSMPGIEYLPEDCRLSITVAARLYSRILDVIERNRYDVFTRRAVVPRKEKLRGLVSAWLGRRLGWNRRRQVGFPGCEEADA
jgi:15-cis-phytoene synthase